MTSVSVFLWVNGTLRVNLSLRVIAYKADRREAIFYKADRREAKIGRVEREAKIGRVEREAKIGRVEREA